MGKFEKIEITEITERNIELKLDRGHEVADFNLSRQTNNAKPFRIINIVQMLKINREMKITFTQNQVKPNLIQTICSKITKLTKK